VAHHEQLRAGMLGVHVREQALHRLREEEGLVGGEQHADETYAARGAPDGRTIVGLVVEACVAGARQEVVHGVHALLLAHGPGHTQGVVEIADPPDRVAVLDRHRRATEAKAEAGSRHRTKPYSGDGREPSGGPCESPGGEDLHEEHPAASSLEVGTSWRLVREAGVRETGGGGFLSTVPGSCVPVIVVDSPSEQRGGLPREHLESVFGRIPLLASVVERVPWHDAGAQARARLADMP
jgi:hypothetical protein